MKQYKQSTDYEELYKTLKEGFKAIAYSSRGILELIYDNEKQLFWIKHTGRFGYEELVEANLYLFKRRCEFLQTSWILP